MRAETLLSIITIHKDDWEALQVTWSSLQPVLNDPRVEWVVIDGGSRLCEGGELVSRIRAQAASFVSEADDGIFDAMNKGTARARGRFLLFMNAGDLLVEPGLVALVAAHAHDCDVLLGQAQEGEDPATSQLKGVRSPSRAWYGMPTHHQAMVFRASLCRRYPYDTTLRYAADYKLLCQCVAAGLRIATSPATICHFDLSGVSSRNFVAGLREQQIVRREVLGISGPTNLVIYGLRLLARCFRVWFPGLYALVRYRSEGRAASRKASRVAAGSPQPVRGRS
jgi:putative colanic acid biosynthesis glycosyltransferase